MDGGLASPKSPKSPRPGAAGETTPTLAVPIGDEAGSARKMDTMRTKTDFQQVVLKSPRAAGDAPATKRSQVMDGDAAFQEVAKKNGIWNWVLVGSDPERLPLSGGGSESIPEMRQALADHPNTFGLIRMVFGKGLRAKVKHVFVHCSMRDEAESGKTMAPMMTNKERANLTMNFVKMERKIEKYARLAAKLEITNKDDLTLENLCERLRAGSPMDSEYISPQSFQEGHQEFLQVNQEVLDHYRELHWGAHSVKKAAVPHFPRRRSSMDRQPVLASAAVEDTRQRKMVRPYKVGDKVEIFSTTTSEFIDDGTVEEVLNKEQERDGFKLSVGAMKVKYDRGRRQKWVLLSQMAIFMRPSTRPEPPAPLDGELLKEIHNFSIEWEPRYCQVSRGCFLWWENKRDFDAGLKSRGLFSLLGLELTENGTFMSMRSASTTGAVYSFDASKERNLAKWTKAIREHADFCDTFHAYEQKRDEERQEEWKKEIEKAQKESPELLKRSTSILVGGGKRQSMIQGYSVAGTNHRSSISGPRGSISSVGGERGSVVQMSMVNSVHTYPFDPRVTVGTFQRTETRDSIGTLDSSAGVGARDSVTSKASFNSAAAVGSRASIGSLGSLVSGNGLRDSLGSKQSLETLSVLSPYGSRGRPDSRTSLSSTEVQRGNSRESLSSTAVQRADTRQSLSSTLAQRGGSIRSSLTSRTSGTFSSRPNGSLASYNNIGPNGKWSPGGLATCDSATDLSDTDDESLPDLGNLDIV